MALTITISDIRRLITWIHPAVLQACWDYAHVYYIYGCTYTYNIIYQKTLWTYMCNRCSFLCLLMSIPVCLFWTYIWHIQWRWSPYVHILCGLLSSDSSPIYKKCCHVFAHSYTLDDNLEHPMDNELALFTP